MWLPIDPSQGFGLKNLPIGVFSTALQPQKRVGMALGDYIIDLNALYQTGALGQNFPNVFDQPTANAYIGLDKKIHTQVRQTIRQIVEDPCNPIRYVADQFLVKRADAHLHLPLEIGDYTDFYSSIEHATNVGKMFRDPANALLPNWRHLPVGYHGRASSILVSGQAIHRPWGQTMPKDATSPVFQPSKRMDFELEMAFVIGKNTEVGEFIRSENAEEYIYGLVLFNDWSARDIQQWEYVPLGPFLGKNFASSMSPWIVSLEALEDFRVESPTQEPAVLPYLATQGKRNFSIDLTVTLETKEKATAQISRSNTRYLYWNIAQQLAHHTVNGCNVRVGDLMASGTISGPTKDSFGSMLELSWAGQEPIQIAENITRTFIEDYDTITMEGMAKNEKECISFGEVRTTLLPAKTR